MAGSLKTGVAIYHNLHVGNAKGPRPKFEYQFDFSIQYSAFDLFLPHLQTEFNLMPAAFQTRTCSIPEPKRNKPIDDL